ncbi:MAG TPA: glycine oxidase ThiO [Jatrophihabitantaceae bacterium]|nr:glycine oxidase ThiO [Jatrophihabitantaceae bacterium]
MRSDVIVVGGGVIGLGIAWRCAQRGLGVTVVDPSPGSGATWTAAGMLAPTTELHYGEQALLALGLESARRYPAFVAELEDATGIEVGYRRDGTIVAAWDAADLAGLRDLQEFGRTLGLTTELVTGRELRRLEPALASGLPGGLIAADDCQIDNRRLHDALVIALERAGGRLVRERAASVSGDRVTLATGDVLPAATVVVAAGAWTGQLDGVPAGAVPVHPVKGQTLRLRQSGDAQLRHVVRGVVRGSPVYLIPRTNGEIVVGASSEEAGFDLSPRAGAIYELLRDAQALVPVLGEATFGEVSTSLRPGSPDNAPMVGPTSVAGLVVATGHYRNGILLAPVTADGVAELIADGALPDVLAPFTPSRFERASA